MPPGIYRFKCRSPTCKNIYYSPVTDKNYVNKHFFRFPNDETLRMKWFDAITHGTGEFIKLSNSKNIYLCEDHFETRLFTSTRKKTFLIRSDAIPTNFSTKKIKILQNNLLNEPQCSAEIDECVSTSYSQKTNTLIENYVELGGKVKGSF